MDIPDIMTASGEAFLKSRIIIISVFVGCLSIIAVVAFVRAKQLKEVTTPPVIRPAVVRCDKLERREYTMTESFYGLVEANATIDMAFQITGRLTKLGKVDDRPLKEGDIVRQGTELAHLEPLRYKAAAQQAKAEEDAANARLRIAQADFNQAKAQHTASVALHKDSQSNLKDIEIDVTKKRELHEAGVLNKRELDKIEIQYELALSSVTQAKAKADAAMALVDAAKAKVESADAFYLAAKSMTTVANVNLEDATLRAPSEGTIAAVPVEVGQMIKPGETVMRLVDLEKVRLAVGVVESRIPLLQEGQKVDVELLALSSDRLGKGEHSKPHTGVVTVVPPAADPKTGLFNIEIEIANKDRALKPGMVGKATIQIETRWGYYVPAAAVTRSGDRLWAYFVTNGYTVGLDIGQIGNSKIEVPMTVARRVQLEPVMTGKDYYLVRDVEGEFDRLVVEGQSRLIDGQPVEVIDIPAFDATASAPPEVTAP